MSESIYPGLTRAHNRLVAAAQEASAELRRLHEVNTELLKALEALVTADELHDELWDQVHAAIDKATGEQA